MDVQQVRCHKRVLKVLFGRLLDLVSLPGGRPMPVTVVLPLLLSTSIGFPFLAGDQVPVVCNWHAAVQGIINHFFLILH